MSSSKTSSPGGLSDLSRSGASPGAVVVSGGTYGIGRAITLELLRRGHPVVAFGWDQPQPGTPQRRSIAETAAQIQAGGWDGLVLEADVTSPQAMEEVVQAALSRYGRLHGVVNNAAIHPRGTLLDTDLETWERTLAVNLTGMFLLTRAALPHLMAQGRGVVINIGSASGWGRPNLLAYCASKGGVFALSQALAYDHRAHHIRVNVVVPGGLVLSGMTEDLPPDRLAQAASQTVAGRNVLPEDVARAVAFLMSDEAEQISGAVLNVGGFWGQGGTG